MINFSYRSTVLSKTSSADFSSILKGIRTNVLFISKAFEIFEIPVSVPFTVEPNFFSSTVLVTPEYSEDKIIIEKVSMKVVIPVQPIVY